MNGIWAIATVGAKPARPQAMIKAATIDGLPVPAIVPSIVASAMPRRSRFGLWPNHSICMMPFGGGVRTATVFLMRTLGRNADATTVTFTLTYVSASVTQSWLARVRAFLETFPETERVRFPRAA